MSLCMKKASLTVALWWWVRPFSIGSTGYRSSSRELVSHYAGVLSCGLVSSARQQLHHAISGIQKIATGHNYSIETEYTCAADKGVVEDTFHWVCYSACYTAVATYSCCPGQTGHREYRGLKRYLIQSCYLLVQRGALPDHTGPGFWHVLVVCPSIL